MNPDGPIVVIKVGGSLLDWPELPVRLADLLSHRPESRVVLIVGGGRLADVLRDLDATHALGESRSHALALRILDATAHVLASLVPSACVVTSLADLTSAWHAPAIPILAPRLVLDADDLTAPRSALPHSWSVSTDSISARVAELLEASELVLAKSVDPALDGSIASSSVEGRVDPYFRIATADLPLVSYVNLRETSIQVRRLR